MVVIKKCNCKHEFQDNRYGSFLRIFNILSNDKGYRCTVCGKEKAK